MTERFAILLSRFRDCCCDSSADEPKLSIYCTCVMCADHNITSIRHTDQTDNEPNASTEGGASQSNILQPQARRRFWFPELTCCCFKVKQKRRRSVVEETANLHTSQTEEAAHQTVVPLPRVETTCSISSRSSRL